jgi:hypothetical protein
MKTPTTTDMKVGAVIANQHGEWTVVKVQPYGWEVRKSGRRDEVVVFEDQLKFYTLKG